MAVHAFLNIVTLKDRTSGTYTLNIELTHDFRELPKLLVIAGVHPLGTAKPHGLRVSRRFLPNWARW